MLSKHGSERSPEARAQWELVERIAKSPGLTKSPRLSRLLHHVCERTLSGRPEELTEQKIGVSLFDRRADYSPSEDNIVRAHARLLRQKLELYFTLTGSGEEWLLTIPKGGYVPHFEKRPADAPAETPIPVDLPVAAVQAAPRSRVPVAVALVVGLILGATPFVVSSVSATLGQRHPLWSRVFERDRTTMLVAADSALVMYQNLSKRSVNLTEYIRRRNQVGAPTTPPPTPGLPPTQTSTLKALEGDFGSRRYTSFADLSLIGRLVSLPQVRHELLRVDFARDVSINDFKRANAVLSGAVEANPWLELVQSRFQFVIETDQIQGSFLIRNKTPASGEPPAYLYNPKNDTQLAYAHLAFLPADGNTGNVLVIEGTTTAGTEAAADFILNDTLLAPLLEQAKLPNGEIGRFELLLQARNIGGSAPRAVLVASRFESTARR